MKKILQYLIYTITICSIFYLTDKLINYSVYDLINTYKVINILIVFILLLSIQNILHAVRLMYCIKFSNYRLKFTECWRICNLGALSSFTPASFILGDAVRYTNLIDNNISKLDSISILFIDRLAGIFSMFLIFLISFLLLMIFNLEFLNFIINNLQLKFYSLIFFLIIFFIAFFKYKKKIFEKFNYIGKLKFDQFLILIFISFAMSSIPSICALIFDVYINDANSLTIFYLITGIINFISIFPFTVLGLGIREGLFYSIFKILKLNTSVGLLLGFLLSVSIIMSIIFSYFLGKIYDLIRRIQV